jgi:hypothetical protein
MFLVLWEYEVKPGCEDRFEKLYGPAGDWAQLFQSDSHYQETRLLRDPFRLALYVTLDFWTSSKSYEQFMAAHTAEYQAIDSAGESLTVKERRAGAYESLAP